MEELVTKFSDSDYSAEIKDKGTWVFFSKYSYQNFDTPAGAIKALSGTLALLIKAADAHKAKLKENAKDGAPIDLSDIPF